MPGNVENTRAEGTFGQGAMETAPKMPEKPMNTRAEGTSGKEGTGESETERECREKIARFLGFLRDFWDGGSQTDEKLEIMLELSEAVTRNLKEIQRARMDAKMEGGKENGRKH